MPKILENVREQLLAEAMKQIRENGYKKLTIRSVAGACGLSVGTVYNYFESKDMLVASFMLEDWQKTMNAMKDGIAGADTNKQIMFCMYQELKSFLSKYVFLFQDEDAGKVFASAFADRHKLLRGQLQALLMTVCGGDTFLEEFLAENILTWTVAGKEFEEIYRVLGRTIE